MLHDIDVDGDPMSLSDPSFPVSNPSEVKGHTSSQPACSFQWQSESSLPHDGDDVVTTAPIVAFTILISSSRIPAALPQPITAKTCTSMSKPRPITSQPCSPLSTHALASWLLPPDCPSPFTSANTYTGLDFCAKLWLLQFLLNYCVI